MSMDKLSLLLNAITLLVIIATAMAGLIQLRHLRHQNTLNAELAVLKDWNEPQFREWRLFIGGELQTRLKDPAFSRRSTTRRKWTARGIPSSTPATGWSRSVPI
jgi:hypothetical protein